MATERILSKEQTAEMGFLRIVLGVTLRDTKSTCLKSVKPGMSSHFFEARDPRYVSSAMCPERAGKDWRSKTFRLQSSPAGKLSRSRPRARWRDYISGLAWSRLGVEPAEVYLIAVDREVFRVFLGLLPPATLPKGKPVTKMNE